MRVELPTYSSLRLLPGSLFQTAPTSWRPIRLKFVMPDVTVGIVITPSKYYVDDGVPAIRSLNVRNGTLTEDDLVFFSEEDNRRLAKTRIYKGDVVIVRTGQTGACAVVNELFDGANCIDLIIVRKSPHLRSKFLQYFLESGEAAAEITMSSNGAIQQHFNIGLVREISLLQPDLDEQDAIITFLDRETAKIDRLMEVRQKQLDRLHEQRTAVIHHAVTKGLNPRVKMKPTEIEWIGQTPDHWAISPLKFTSTLIMGQSPASSDCNEVGVGLPFLQGCADFGDTNPVPKSFCEIPPKRAEKGDVLLSVRAPVGTLNFADQNYGIGRGLCALRGRLIEQSFLHHLLFCAIQYFQSVATGSTYNAVTVAQVGRLIVPVPPKFERDEIIAHINRETSRLDTLIAKYRCELDLLAEYRASLISHAVTGKIDVRGLVGLAQFEEVEVA